LVPRTLGVLPLLSFNLPAMFRLRCGLLRLNLFSTLGLTRRVQSRTAV
jgi:hypothetical protein